MINTEGIKTAVAELLKAIGEDPRRDGLADTPRRIASLYAEVFSGLDEDPIAALNISFDEDHGEMVVLKDIPFYSMCEHHFLPFHGVAHVGYIPNGRVVGLSKLARAVDIFARRPQMQERLTSQIADSLMEALQPLGAAVVIEAEHLCMTMRGVKKPGSKVVTSATRGSFRSLFETREEFMSIIRGR
ncbi:MAG: GTP cyclohydrolase I FolE [Chloroflexi bacterium]|nr:GTP cyclohydrolase I FolE [Chloroflexota bacterium]